MEKWRSSRCAVAWGCTLRGGPERLTCRTAVCPACAHAARNRQFARAHTAGLGIEVRISPPHLHKRAGTQKNKPAILGP